MMDEKIALAKKISLHNARGTFQSYPTLNFFFYTFNPQGEIYRWSASNGSTLHIRRRENLIPDEICRPLRREFKSRTRRLSKPFDFQQAASD